MNTVSDIQDTFTIELSLDEALALASMLHAADWVGLELPRELEDIDAQEMVRKGAQSLANRGYLTAGEDGEMRLHAGLLRMIQTALRPWAILALSAPGDGLPRYLFLAPDLRVEMHRMDEAHVELTAVRHLVELRQRALDFLGASGNIDTPQAAFELDFAATGGVIPEDMPGIVNLLNASGVPQGAQQPLVDVLSGRKSFASLLVFDSVMPDVPVEDLNWLASPEGFWLVRGIEGEHVGARLQFEPLDVDTLREMVCSRIVCPDNMTSV